MGEPWDQGRCFLLREAKKMDERHSLDFFGAWHHQFRRDLAGRCFFFFFFFWGGGSCGSHSQGGEVRR